MIIMPIMPAQLHLLFLCSTIMAMMPSFVKAETVPNQGGTTIYKENQAFAGYNIFTSNNDRGNGFVKLIDMNGNLIYQWKEEKTGAPFVWKTAIPFPDGSLLLTSYRTDADWQWVDADSHALVVYNLPEYKAHHSTCYLKNGDFISLVSRKKNISYKDRTLNIVEHSLVQISSLGRLQKIISLNKFLEDDPEYRDNLENAYNKLKESKAPSSGKKIKTPTFDLLRPDNIESLGWNIPGIVQKGAWLVTFENLNRICIIDPIKERIVWQWGEDIISSANHATFLEGDKILLLDNGVRQQSSRAIILDIQSKRIIWQYGQKPGQEFFSAVGGSVQRLPNGNIFIVECAKGRAFEVTPNGETVWEWFSELSTQEKVQRHRRKIYKMIRLPYDFFKDQRFNYKKTSDNIKSKI